VKRVFHHLAFYNRLCIAKPFYTTQLAGNTPFCRLKHQRLQKAMLNCFQTWNKANKVVRKRINKNRLQHIFRLKTPQTKKTTLCLQTFDGKHAVAQPAQTAMALRKTTQSLLQHGRQPTCTQKNVHRLPENT